MKSTDFQGSQTAARSHSNFLLLCSERMVLTYGSAILTPMGSRLNSLKFTIKPSGFQCTQATMENSLAGLTRLVAFFDKRLLESNVSLLESRYILTSKERLRA